MRKLLIEKQKEKDLEKKINVDFSAITEKATLRTAKKVDTFFPIEYSSKRVKAGLMRNNSKQIFEIQDKVKEDKKTVCK